MLAEARRLSLFGNDLKAMDEIVDKFKMIASKYIIKGKKNFFAVIEHLRKYSCKTRGVSFCKVATMANILGISERTIQRIINRLVELGLVKKLIAVDKKTGSRLPNYYQIQSKVDWHHVVDSLEPKIVVMDGESLVELAEGHDTQSVTDNATLNVTPPTIDKPLINKRSWAFSVRGSIYNAFRSNKKIYEYKEPTYTVDTFPFHNWLE